MRKTACKRDPMLADGDDYDRCFICGGVAVQTHHIFGGALRKKSDRYGLTVRLCRTCHNEPPNGVHHNKQRMEILHKYGQRKAMKEQGWTREQFMDEFYKNYLEEEQ